MKLLIDIGNSRLKWCLSLANGELTQPFAIEHGSGLFLQMLDETWQALPKPDAVVMLSVASDDIAAATATWVKNSWDLDVIKLKTQVACAGVVNGYLRPEQLGVDRWAAVVAGYQLAKGAVCIIDSGTALTIDVVSDNGRHLGGLITPGRFLQREGLYRGTSALTNAGNSAGDSLWGRDTTSCIESGLIQAQCGLIERSVKQLRRESHDDVVVVMTGGDAAVLLSRLEQGIVYVPDLVFQGMTYMLLEH